MWSPPPGGGEPGSATALQRASTVLTSDVGHSGLEPFYSSRDTWATLFAGTSASRQGARRPLPLPEPGRGVGEEQIRGEEVGEGSVSGVARLCGEDGVARPWAELLARTFAVDVLSCPSCQGRMRLLAMVKDPASITRYLAAVGEATEVPRRSPGRGPPY